MAPRDRGGTAPRITDLPPAQRAVVLALLAARRTARLRAEHAGHAVAKQAEPSAPMVAQDVGRAQGDH